MPGRSIWLEGVYVAGSSAGDCVCIPCFSVDAGLTSGLRIDIAMQIIRHPESLPAELRSAVVAIGNFDGVHLGHRSIIDTARSIAVENGRPLAVLTFEPHPRSYFQGNKTPFRLTQFRQKVRVIAATGVDFIVNLTFASSMARKLAQVFVHEYLVEKLAVSHVVTGPGFVFGNGRRGNGYILSQMAEREGFVYVEAPVCKLEDKPVSSTEIRVLVRRGQMPEAANLLGRLWEHEGKVIQGERVGRTLGFPTTNQPLEGILHPGPGIYAVLAGVPRNGQVQWFDGAAYVGTRPTFNGSRVQLETFLFDFDADIYGDRLRVAFVERIRRDMTFDSIDALQSRMQIDCNRARQILTNHRSKCPDLSVV